MGAAVETVTTTDATALVYTNSVATSPVSKNIAVAAIPVLPVDDGAPRREMVDHPHVDGDVIDLTPQL